jgi:hypothetical protein
MQQRQAIRMVDYLESFKLTRLVASVLADLLQRNSLTCVDTEDEINSSKSAFTNNLLNGVAKARVIANAASDGHLRKPEKVVADVWSKVGNDRTNGRFSGIRWAISRFTNLPLKTFA